jgi:hypothetical protein
MGTQPWPTKMRTQGDPAEMGTQGPTQPDGTLFDPRPNKGTQPDLALWARTLLGKGLAVLVALGFSPKV